MAKCDNEDCGKVLPENFFPGDFGDYCSAECFHDEEGFKSNSDYHERMEEWKNAVRWE